MPTAPDPRPSERRGALLALSFPLLALGLLASLFVLVGPLVSPSQSLHDIVRFLSAPVAYGVPLGSLGLWGVLFWLSRQPSEGTTELERRSDHVAWTDGPELEIEGRPVVVVRRDVQSRTDTNRRGRTYRSGVSIHWLPSGAEQHRGPDAEADALEARLEAEGVELVEFTGGRRRARDFSETLADLGDADLYWIRNDFVTYRGRDELDDSLAERLRGRTLEPCPDPEELGTEIELSDDGTTVCWKPSRRGKLMGTLATGGMFGVVGGVIATILGGWTTRTFWILGMLASLVGVVGVAAWVWYGLRTQTIAFSPDGIVVTDNIAGLWSRSEQIPSDAIEELTWEPSAKHSRARLWAVGDGESRPVGPSVRGARARRIRTMARHVFSPDSTVI
jgi:hypothetical protein